MLKFLSDNSGALTVCFTFVVTLSTVFYVVLTACLASETKKMRLVQTEPKLELTVKSCEEWINIVKLHVRNIGLGPAYNIKFSFDDLSKNHGSDAILSEFRKSNFLNSGLTYLGPNHEVHSNFAKLDDNAGEKIYTKFTVGVTYQNCIKSTLSEEFTIDLSEFLGRTQIGKPHLYAIAQGIEKLQKDLNNVLTGFKRVHVEVYDRHDREQEHESLQNDQNDDQE